MTATPAGRPRSRLAAGMNDHGRSRSTRSAWCFVCSVISAGAATGGAGNDSGRGRTGRGAGRYRRAFRRQPGADRPVLRRFVPICRTSSPSSNASSARAMSRAAPRPCIPSRAARPLVGASALPTVPASWSRPCAAPTAARHGKSSPASASTNCAPLCDACLLRLQAMFGDAGGVGELNPGAVASPAKDSGGPGARLHPLRLVGRITPWALSADTPEARPGLERHPLPVVQCLQASRSRSWALSRA